MTSSQFLAIMLQNVKALESSYGFDSACKTKDGNADSLYVLVWR